MGDDAPNLEIGCEIQGCDIWVVVRELRVATTRSALFASQVRAVSICAHFTARVEVCESA
jgi:hypothetical protein